ncbi:hypothetical protein GOODEAATRI_031502, partial [Goodea atripinnis]
FQMRPTLQGGPQTAARDRTFSTDRGHLIRFEELIVVGGTSFLVSHADSSRRVKLQSLAVFHCFLLELKLVIDNWNVMTIPASVHGISYCLIAAGNSWQLPPGHGFLELLVLSRNSLSSEARHFRAAMQTRRVKLQSFGTS